jgi:hypothetical protein
VEADPSQTQPSVPSNIGATRHARLGKAGVLDASRALLFARCCVDSNGRRARWVLLRWWSGPVTRRGRVQRAAKLAREMAPCRLGSGRCMVEVLFALLITETSELGVSWPCETGRPRRQALRRGGCHRCETRQRESTPRSAAVRQDCLRPFGGSIPSTGHLCPSTCNPVRRREEAAGANASSRAAVFVVVHSDV